MLSKVSTLMTLQGRSIPEDAGTRGQVLEDVLPMLSVGIKNQTTATMD